MKRKYQKPEMVQETCEIENNLMVTSLPIGDDTGYDQFSNEDSNINIWGISDLTEI